MPVRCGLLPQNSSTMLSHGGIFRQYGGIFAALWAPAPCEGAREHARAEVGVQTKDAVVSTPSAGSAQGNEAIGVLWEIDVAGLAGDLAHLESEYEVSDRTR